MSRPFRIGEMIVAALVIAFVAVGVGFFRWIEPTASRLSRDLRWLASANVLREYRDAEFTDVDVARYYSSTTFRDYKVLEWATGSSAMHSKLVPGVALPYDAGCMWQLLYVMREMGAARNVVEVGCGKGSNTIFLACIFPEVQFLAVDLVREHVEYASRHARRAGLTNVAFVEGDASRRMSCVADGAVDLVFGVESCCHMDTPEKMAGFLRSASCMLRCGGKLVIVDGFRAERFGELADDVREAMNLAESGFRIRSMPSKKRWAEGAACHGMICTREVDLTREALGFWVRGWKAAQALRVLAPFLVVRYLLRSGVRRRRETGASFVGVLMTAYALALGSAEYGVLAFEARRVGVRP